MRLTTLPAHLRKWGLDVVEVDGWRTRGVDFPATPAVVIWHHTGTAQSAKGNYPSLAIVRDGRGGKRPLKGPLSQVGLGRDGRVYVIAAGKANHAGEGRWAGITQSARTVGIEAESPGDGTWTPQQRRNYPILAAALHDLLRSPANLSCGHREWALPAGRKPDPVGIDMPAMRRQTAAILKAGLPKVTAHTQAKPTPLPTSALADGYPYTLEDPMLLEKIVVNGEENWFTVTPDLSRKTSVEDGTTLAALRKAGYKTIGVSERQLKAMPTTVPAK